MGFASDIDSWKNKSINRSNDAVKYLCFNMSNQIIKLTPVDTGIAKNNWQASLDSPDRSKSSSANKTGSDAVSKANEKSRMAAGHVYYFVNSLDYIKRLENGWSKQAASGMVMITVARFRNLFTKAIR